MKSKATLMTELTKTFNDLLKQKNVTGWARNKLRTQYEKYLDNATTEELQKAQDEAKAVLKKLRDRVRKANDESD